MAYIISVCALPAEFTGLFADDPEKPVRNWHMFFCVASGLWGGLIIGLVTEFFTSNRFTPVQVRPLARALASSSLAGSAVLAVPSVRCFRARLSDLLPPAPLPLCCRVCVSPLARSPTSDANPPPPLRPAGRG